MVGVVVIGRAERDVAGRAGGRGPDVAVWPGHTPTSHGYLRWRNANARHRDILATELKERARSRSEKGICWGGRPLQAAA
jgi:hypothetical protein